ncbi:MAG: hypothetical protein KBG48_00265 [Kofleriaceae bacterium]|jgi:hypothetical protein|nr:hypothetical protein [Kofleriaceae bacterium]MBP9165776.1 hypothetical protein [Kofleriaceae bacterium]MBP9857925.1 hypothetical protein [Kofleriaceae bacterium]
MSGKKKAGWLRYLKEAFTYRWNLLIFGGATAAAVISGRPDVALPLVAAGELAYLAGLTTLPRFQAAIDAKARREERGADAAAAFSGDRQSARQRLADTLGSLEADRRNRFLRLRARCVEMQRIANAVRGDTRDASGAAHELRTPALDRLLWVFLRLLLSQQALGRFLRAADGAGIQRQLDELTARQKEAETRGDERILRSLVDSVATAQLRLDNYNKAKNNAEFVTIELDRIESKIQALTEMAISHQNPDELSIQVDAVAAGMSQTEETIRELQSITGLSEREDAPSILTTDVTEAS